MKKQAGLCGNPRTPKPWPPKEFLFWRCHGGGGRPPPPGLPEQPETRISNVQRLYAVPKQVSWAQPVRFEQSNLILDLVCYPLVQTQGVVIVPRWYTLSLVL